MAVQLPDTRFFCRGLREFLISECCTTYRFLTLSFFPLNNKGKGWISPYGSTIVRYKIFFVVASENFGISECCTTYRFLTLSFFPLNNKGKGCILLMAVQLHKYKFFCRSPREFWNKRMLYDLFSLLNPFLLSLKQ
jgi:hypothetical protein